MTSPGKTAMDYQMVPEDGHGVPERTPDPAGAIFAGDPPVTRPRCVRIHRRYRPGQRRWGTGRRRQD
jgi:hypothetical protein